MIALPEVSSALRAAAQQADLTQAALAEQAGISPRTLSYVLSGQEDFRVSTLLALADRLGLELLLVPRAAAGAVNAGQTPHETVVVSQVADALARLRSREQEIGAAPGDGPKPTRR